MGSLQKQLVEKGLADPLPEKPPREKGELQPSVEECLEKEKTREIRTNHKKESGKYAQVAHGHGRAKIAKCVNTPPTGPAGPVRRLTFWEKTMDYGSAGLKGRIRKARKLLGTPEVTRNAERMFIILQSVKQKMRSKDMVEAFDKMDSRKIRQGDAASLLRGLSEDPDLSHLFRVDGSRGTARGAGRQFSLTPEGYNTAFSKFLKLHPKKRTGRAATAYKKATPIKKAVLTRRYAQSFPPPVQVAGVSQEVMEFLQDPLIRNNAMRVFGLLKTGSDMTSMDILTLFAEIYPGKKLHGPDAASHLRFLRERSMAKDLVKIAQKGKLRKYTLTDMGRLTTAGELEDLYFGSEEDQVRVLSGLEKKVATVQTLGAKELDPEKDTQEESVKAWQQQKAKEEEAKEKEEEAKEKEEELAAAAQVATQPGISFPTDLNINFTIRFDFTGLEKLFSFFRK